MKKSLRLKVITRKLLKSFELEKMEIRRYLRLLMIISITFLLLNTWLESAIPTHNSSLLYREDWIETPEVFPLTQDQISHPDLNLNLYGAAKTEMKKSHHEKIIDDPYYIWSGKCSNNWLVTFTHRKFEVDLTGHAKIRWRTKQSGFRQLHLVLKLKDGTWLISDQSQVASKDWRVSEFKIMDIQWHRLNIKTITEKKKVSSVNLSQVEEIGFTDLMRGGLSLASSRVDWIEVYGKPSS